MITAEKDCKFDLFTIGNASCPFVKDKKNDFTCFNQLVGKRGVYVFTDNLTNEILYVGEAHKQDLKNRIAQNYTELDTGGSFRDKYIQQEKASYLDFKKFLQQCRINFIFLNNSSEKSIRDAEEQTIIMLKPKYN